MRFELKLAARYLRSRRQSLARFTAIAAVVGITVGVACLIVADALGRGFSSEMRTKILNQLPHITVTAVVDQDTTALAGLSEDLKSIPNVAAVLPGSTAHALVSSDDGATYAMIIASTSDRVRIGRKLAERIGVTAGDKIEIITVDGRSPFRITVAEIFESGLSDQDLIRIEVPPEKFAALTGSTVFSPRRLEITTIDPFAASGTAAQIRTSIGDRFEVADWQEANRPLFAALSLERRVVATVISLIMLVAALNITTTLALLAHERRFDFGVLRTCGMKRSGLMAVVLAEGVFLALAGAVFGVAIGLIVCVAGNQLRLVNIPEEVYSLSYIPFEPSVFTIVSVAACAIAIALLAALWPAVLAARVKPLDNLRSN